MSDCPFCQHSLPPEILAEGGYCPSCGELILLSAPDEDEFYSHTESFSPEEIPTEELEETDEIIQEIEAVEAKEEASDPEDDFGTYELDLEEDVSEEDFGLDPEELQSFQKEPIQPKNAFPLGWVTAFLCVAVVVVVFYPKEEEDIPEVTADIYVPDLNEHKGNEVEQKEEVVEEDSSTEEVSNTPKRTAKAAPSRAKPKLVEKNGLKVVQTAAAINRSNSRVNFEELSDEERVKKDVNRLRKNLKYCYTRTLKKEPDVTGQWQVSFTLRASGEPRNIRVKALREPHSGIEECLESRAAKFNYSKLRSAKPVKFLLLDFD